MNNLIKNNLYSVQFYTLFFGALYVFFDTNNVWQGYFDLWQYLGHKELVNDTYTAFYYLHAQPPAQNLLFLLLLKIQIYSGVDFIIISKIVSLVIFMISSFLFFEITRNYKGVIKYIVLTIFFASPSLYTYLNWPYYAWLITPLLLGILLCLQKEKYVFALVLMVLAVYVHQVMLILAFLGMFFYSKKLGKIMIAIAILLLLTWPLKNLLVFNSFTFSSWSGCNIALVTGYEKNFYNVAYYPDKDDLPDVLKLWLKDTYDDRKSNNYNNVDTLEHCRMNSDHLAIIKEDYKRILKERVAVFKSLLDLTHVKYECCLHNEELRESNILYNILNDSFLFSKEAVYWFNVFIYYLAPFLLFFFCHNKKIGRWYALSYVACTIMFVLFNSYEHERMTVPFFFLTLAILPMLKLPRRNSSKEFDITDQNV